MELESLRHAPYVTGFWKTVPTKSHIKSGVFLHVLNDISIYAYVFPYYFLNSFSNLSTKLHVVL